MIKQLLLVLAFLITGICLYAQCDYFPADCPETGDLESAQDSDACIRNLIVPEEITMQNILRRQLTEMMEQVAKNKNWELYEYTESAGGGIGINDNAKPLPYALRHPHQFTISFDVVVNKDSLQAWRNWYSNDLKNASDKVVDSYKQAGTNLSQDENHQRNVDSSMYYSNLKAKYMTDHANDYQKAILSGDTKGQKKYEDEMKRYDDRINAFVNKANNKTTEGYSTPESQLKDLDSYKHKNMIAFRNGSTIRVSFNVNDYLATGNDADKRIIKQMSQPPAALGLLLHNDSPDEHEIFGQYSRSPDVIMMLFGKWSLKQDQYHGYHSSYSEDKKNTDAVTPKKIPCDKVQTIVLHIEGSLKYMNQFLGVFDLQKLNSLIIKE